MNYYWWETLTRTQKVTTALVPLLWITTQGSQFVLLLDILNCLMGHSRPGKCIPCNSLHPMDINIFLSWSVFSHWTEVFPWRHATTSSVVEALLEKIITTWGFPFKLHNDWGALFLFLRLRTHFTCQVLWQVCVGLSLLQHFRSIYHPQSSGLLKIKTQMAKFAWTRQKGPWPKYFQWSF